VLKKNLDAVSGMAEEDLNVSCMVQAEDTPRLRSGPAVYF